MITLTMHNTETRRQKTALQFQHHPPPLFSQYQRSHGSKSKSTNKDQQRRTKADKQRRQTKNNKDEHRQTKNKTNTNQQNSFPTKRLNATLT